MKISEIVKTSATLLAREDVVEYLANPNTEDASKNTLETVDLLTRLTNLVIRELAEGLIYMTKTIKIDGVSSVNFSDYGIEPLTILGVYDREGNKLSFSLSSYDLTVKYGLIYSIEYSYLPKNYGLSDTVGDFEKNVTMGILAYGVLAEFCLTEARFDEAVMWHERYVNAVNQLQKPKNARIKGRTFV